MAATLEASSVVGSPLGSKLGGDKSALAVSSLQASGLVDGSYEELENRFLVSSPYTSQPHLLDLSALTTSQALLAKALTYMEAVKADYATAPYEVAFNWDTVVNNLRSLASSHHFRWQSQHFYIVVFRSQIPSTSVREELGRLDEKSHMEANKSGGLLKYWFGVPDANGRNLATCKLPSGPM